MREPAVGRTFLSDCPDGQESPSYNRTPALSFGLPQHFLVDKVGNVALGRRRFFLTVVITVAQDAISAGAVLWTMALSATVRVRKKHVAGLLAGLRPVMATGALHHAVATMAESAMLQPAPGDCSRLILRQTPGTAAFLHQVARCAAGRPLEDGASCPG